MAKFCGGIKLGNTFKVIKGVICDAATSTVDMTKAITTCGQLWDGTTFAVVDKTISLVAAEEGAVEPIKSNCGIMLDGRYFTVTKGVVDYESPAGPEPDPDEPRGDA